ncbi:MAG: ferrous iron transporter B [Ruminococcaceae bacterium]|nr:ferrous iron transporter B [Oscillospiraceae bacterium]
MDKQFTVALAGNPNVGKSTIFNALTGMKQHTGNWTGKTVETAAGYFKTNKNNYRLVDLPGTYSLIPHSLEEKVARDFIISKKPDTVIIVCDATTLCRNLTLVLQTIAVSQRALVCVNLLDEAKKNGIEIDLKMLEKRLGVRVVGTTARNKKTIDNLLLALDEVLTQDPKTEFDFKADEETALEAVNRAEEICNGIITYKNKNYKKRDLKIDKIITSKAFGFPLMLLLLCFIFWLTINGANYPSELLFKGFSWLEGELSALLLLLDCPKIIHNALIFGVFRTVSFIVSVMLPPMAIFFPLFTLLEDLGFLPRIAFNLDKPFKSCGACGKQALTMCMGFGCNAAGVTGCRIIDSPRERLLAILTNAFVPCNGRFPTIIAIITMFLIGGGISGSVTSAIILTAVITFGIILTFLATKLLSKTVLKGMPSNFILELPPYRCPQILKVIVRSIFDRTLFVLGRSLIVAAPAGLIIFIMSNAKINDITLLSYCADFLDPFARLLGLDGVILIAFILGFPANEIVVPIIIMAYMQNGILQDGFSLSFTQALFIENGWTVKTAISVLIFTLCHWPCSTTVLTIKKETASIKWTLLSILLPTGFGVVLCVVFNLIYNIVV